MPRMIVRYDALLADWRAVVSRIAEHLECTWPRSVDDAADDIDAFVSPQLRHHVASTQRGDGADAPPELVQRLFDACRRAATEADGWSEQNGRAACRERWCQYV